MVFLSRRSCPGRAGHPAAAAAAELTARSPPALEPQAEARGGPRSGRRPPAAATTGARRPRRVAGRRRTAAGGGGRGRAIPICSPDHSAACREERLLSGWLRAAAAATARRLAAPSSPSQPTPTHGQALSLLSPSRFSLAVSSSQTAREKGEGESSSSVRADWRSLSAGARERGRAGRGG